MKHKSSKAVTFMELLIAVIITGLLAGVAIPSYTQTLREIDAKMRFQALRDGKAKIEQYIVAQFRYYTSITRNSWSQQFYK